MKVLDLFSGIGGFSLGLERAGMKTVAFCEIEDYPVKILNKHWPGVPVHRDIRELNGEQYRNTINVICGGFPCQPFSVAGKQRGEKDDRHLWPEMYRLIKEIRPRWVIGENVNGLVRLGLDKVLFDLEAEGYTVQTFIIPACAVNAVHRRDRVWIIGYTEHNGSHDAEVGQGNKKGNDRNEKGSDEVCELERSGRQGGNDADALRPRTETRLSAEDTGKEGNTTKPYDNSDRQLRKFQQLRVPTESPVRHRDDGIPDRVARLKALGNAVVPQIPELIARAIMEIEND